jgi:hypothetical protein
LKSIGCGEASSFSVTGRRRPTAAELLATPGALLTRTHLAEVGLIRTMVDSTFCELDVIFLPSCRRAAVRREDFVEFPQRGSYGRDRVRPT